MREREREIGKEREREIGKERERERERERDAQVAEPLVCVKTKKERWHGALEWLYLRPRVN